MTQSNQLPACADCKFSSPSAAYPQVRCNVKGGFVAPQFKCMSFERRAGQ